MAHASERGNVLIFILLGIVLFAALSYTVARSFRADTTSKISAREADIAATEIIEFGQRMERAVSRLRRNGCSENQISFAENNGYSKNTNGVAYNYTNTNSPSDFSCHVFHANGGNVNPAFTVSTKAAIDPSLKGGGAFHSQSYVITATRVLGHGQESGAAGTELLLWVGSLTDKVCDTINEKLNLSLAGGSSPLADSYDCNGSVFDGTFSACSNPIGNVETGFEGETSFCNKYDNSGLYINYKHVLIAR